MNGEVQVLAKEKVIFHLKKDVVLDHKLTEIKEIGVSEIEKPISESRFAKLKKSLRKRSASIFPL